MENNGPRIEDNPSAPEIFVSDLLRSNIEAGEIVKLTFGSLRYDMTGDGARFDVNLRLVMSLPSAHALHATLGQWLQRIALAKTDKPDDMPVQ